MLPGVEDWCGGAGFLEYGVKGGRARFPEDRSYMALGVTLHGAMEVRRGRSSLLMGPGEIHLLAPGVSA